MKNSRITNYIAKGFAVILIFALIFLICYGRYRDKMINEKVAAIVAEQKLAKKNTENLQSEKAESEVIDSKKYINKNWMALGDSLTFKNQYQKYVQQICGFANVTTIETPDATLHLMDDKVTKELLNNIDVVTVFASANDFGWNRPLGNINDPTTINTFYSDMKAVIQNIKRNKPEVKLIFITTIYVGKDRYGFLKNSQGITMEDYTKAMKEVCSLNNIPILDLNMQSGINENNLLKYSDDLVHPNDAGMELIGNMIGQFLNTL
jgi:lysophospholipase L1-like esterase